MITLSAEGTIRASKGEILLAQIPLIKKGEVVQIRSLTGSTIKGICTGFEHNLCTIAPLSSSQNISQGDSVSTKGHSLSVLCHPTLLGRVLNGIGEPLDGKDPLIGRPFELFRPAPSPLELLPIRERCKTGIKAIDYLLTLGKGQRFGIMSGPGMGKTTLLSMLAKRTDAPIVVLGLIGERGREISEFLLSLQEQNTLKKTVVVASTSDDPAIVRALAPFTATTVAEYFRDQGHDVFLIIDSLTRAARALRDTALSSGELPLRQGWPASVFAALPRLVERVGRTQKGSITGCYSLLASGDESRDALIDEMKSLLDGHIILSSDIAALGIRPAIDISKSISRVRSQVATNTKEVDTLTRYIVRFIKERELILLGGTPDEELKKILSRQSEIVQLLSQSSDEGYEEHQVQTLIKTIIGS